MASQSQGKPRGTAVAWQRIPGSRTNGRPTQLWGSNTETNERSGPSAGWNFTQPPGFRTQFPRKSSRGQPALDDARTPTISHRLDTASIVLFMPRVQAAPGAFRAPIRQADACTLSGWRSREAFCRRAIHHRMAGQLAPSLLLQGGSRLCFGQELPIHQPRISSCAC